MEIQLKQRLVGLTVIFSLAVIFLPMLLDGSGLTPKPVDVEIPPVPQMETNVDMQEKLIQLERETATLKTLEPLIVDEISDPPDPPPEEEKPAQPDTPAVASESEAPSQQPKTPARTESTEKKPPVDKTVQPKVAEQIKPATVSKTVKKPQVGGDLWVIQTGSFQQKDKAYQQRDRIRKSKLSAVFIEKYKPAGKVSYRVRMGPFLTRKKATIVKNKVRAKYNIKAILMKYEK